MLELTTVDVSLQFLLRPQLDALSRAGHQVVLASAAGSWSERLRRSGYEHHELRWATRGWSLGHDLRLLVELVRLIRGVAPDVVHTHTPKVGVLGRVAAAWCRVPWIVNTQHGLYASADDSWRKRVPVLLVERLAAAAADVELVQNPDDEHTLRRLRVPAAKVRFLGNGVDLARFRPPTAGERTAARSRFGVAGDAVVVAGVGRLVEEKGWRELAAACHDVPQLHCILAGPADTAKSDSLDLSGLPGITWVGEILDVEALYWAADIVAVPSWREGMPRAAIEAAACGLPVVAADVRGSRDVVADGVTGMLYPARDAIALRACLTRLADEPGERQQLGAAARRRAEQSFDERDVVERVLAAIEGRPAPDAGEAQGDRF